MHTDFSKNPLLSPSREKRNLHELQEDYKLPLNKHTYFLIRKGTKTNGLTIPALLVWLLPFLRLLFPRWHPHYNISVLCHDGMVGENGSPKALLYIHNREPIELNWKQATYWTKRLLKEERCAGWRESVIIFAIRYWGDNRRRIKKLLRIK